MLLALLRKQPPEVITLNYSHHAHLMSALYSTKGDAEQQSATHKHTGTQTKAHTHANKHTH